MYGREYDRGMGVGWREGSRMEEGSRI